jgi:hypothetical protein
VDSAGDEIVGNTWAGTIEYGYGIPFSGMDEYIHERSALIQSAPQTFTVQEGRLEASLKLEQWLHTCTVVSDELD